MKKIIIAFMLVLTGMQEPLCAQVTIDNTPPIHSFELIPGTKFGIITRHWFTVALKNANTVVVEVADKAVFEELLNMDSILRVVAKNLEPFIDSIQEDLSYRYINYHDDLSGKIKLRIRKSMPIGESYVLLPDGPARLKVQQDTLIISRHKQLPPGPRNNLVWDSRSFIIRVFINDIRKLNTLIDGSINTALSDINTQWNKLKRWNPKDNWKTNLSSYYNTTDRSLNRPIREPYISEKVHFTAYVQVGLQNLNNSLVTSAGAGFQIVNRIKPGTEYKYILMWEPYFVFDKSVDGNYKMRRNDFITFQHSLQVGMVRNSTQRVEFSQIFGAGYLIHRSGNFFKENTFKVALPGARFKFVNLHPEFVFNDLFKNFQPGLKLFLDLD